MTKRHEPAKSKTTPTGKHPGGRPSKLKSVSIEQMKLLYLDGKTDKQVCEFFNITPWTLNRWKKRHPELKATIKDWKIEADKVVEKCLYKRAQGYTYDEVTYEKSKTGGLGMVMSKGEITALKHTPTAKTKVVTKEVAPDVLAQIFWLKNRQPENWKDRHETTVDVNFHLAERIKTAREKVQQAVGNRIASVN
jgi:hypothetical protein